MAMTASQITDAVSIVNVVGKEEGDAEKEEERWVEVGIPPAFWTSAVQGYGLGLWKCHDVG